MIFKWFSNEGVPTLTPQNTSLVCFNIEGVDLVYAIPKQWREHEFWGVQEDGKIYYSVTPKISHLKINEKIIPYRRDLNSEVLSVQLLRSTFSETARDNRFYNLLIFNLSNGQSFKLGFYTKIFAIDNIAESTSSLPPWIVVRPKQVTKIINESVFIIATPDHMHLPREGSDFESEEIKDKYLEDLLCLFDKKELTLYMLK